MYHDTIHINFKSRNNIDTIITFDYSFMISKEPKDKFSPIKYIELLHKFENIGFDIKYIKFNDIDNEEIVYCTYNYQSNFEIFFNVYKKMLDNIHFNLTFEYGNIIGGKFILNNMNTLSGVWFVDTHNISYDATRNDYNEKVIKNKVFKRTAEYYQIIDKFGECVSNYTWKCTNETKEDFFQRFNVKVALRKFKLERLNKFNENKDI